MNEPCRLGDKISCGDCITEGCSSVFIENLPVATKGCASGGHSGFPGKPIMNGCCSTFFINDKPVAIAGKSTIEPHKKPKISPHQGTCQSNVRTVKCEYYPDEPIQRDLS